MNNNIQTEQDMIDILFLLQRLKNTQNKIKIIITNFGSEGIYPANPSTK